MKMNSPAAIAATPAAGYSRDGGSPSPPETRANPRTTSTAPQAEPRPIRSARLTTRATVTPDPRGSVVPDATTDPPDRLAQRHRDQELRVRLDLLEAALEQLHRLDHVHVAEHLP